MKAEKTFNILENLKQICPEKKDILTGKVNGQWIKHSVQDYISKAEFISYGLMELGLQKGDLVVTISNNRPEWNFMDMALSQAGMIHVPIYPTISISDYNYILNDCKPKLVIVSDKILYNKVSPLAENVSSIIGIFSYNKIENVRNWEEILNLGQENAKKYTDALKKVREESGIHDIVTLIYTSGTTGNPKGVMLSHNNIMSNVRAISKVYDFNHTHRTLSFLPISHVFERTINYYFQSLGLSIYYAENMGTIAENLKEIRPDVFITVPRLLERTYDKIINKGRELSGISKRIFFWAVELGMKYKIPNTNGPIYNLKLKIVDKLIFCKWREALGGKVQLIVVGGAALQPRLATIFNAAGIPVVEGYGLTETSPVIATNRIPSSGNMRIGTVGPPMPGVEVKIDEDGEILCKGPNVMCGYYNEPGLTDEIIDKDGWLHTGDIGTWVENKFLKITDRKKEMFKLSSGKYVAPQVIENKLKESIFIEQAMVIGEHQKFASAIISPDFSSLHDWASMHNIDFKDNKELTQSQKVVARYQKEVLKINKQLGKTEQIRRFRLVYDEWSPDTGELSPTLKLKRKFLLSKYTDLINEIFSLNNNNKD